MNRRMRTVAVVVLHLVAACSSKKEEPQQQKPASGGITPTGNATCDAYGNKILSLKCSQAGQEASSAFASVCKAVSDSENKCLAEYQAIIVCQGNGAKCAADGKVEFGACDAETQKYNDCKNGSTTKHTCADVCAKSTPGVSCPEDANCKKGCDLAESTTACSTELQTYVDCFMKGTSFYCDEDGDKMAKGCEASSAAFLDCLKSKSDAGVPSDGGGD